MDIKIETVEPAKVLGIRRKVGRMEIGDFFMEALPKCHAFATENGMQMTGMPVGVYYESNDEGFDMVAGVQVAEVTATTDEIKEFELPGGRAAKGIHVGHYDNLTDTWSEVTKFIESSGESARMPCWEEYLTDPGEVADPAEWKTLIVEPLE